MCQTDSLSKALISSLYHIICVLFAILVQGNVTEVECRKRVEYSQGLVYEIATRGTAATSLKQTETARAKSNVTTKTWKRKWKVIRTTAQWLQQNRSVHARGWTCVGFRVWDHVTGCAFKVEFTTTRKRSPALAWLFLKVLIWKNTEWLKTSWFIMHHPDSQVLWLRPTISFQSQN